MIWRMHQFQVNSLKGTGWYDDSRLIAAYQDYDESRIDRSRGSNNRNMQAEKVKVYSLNWDATKRLGKSQFYYGFELVGNRVGSIGNRTNITTGAVSPFVSRYPDGSNTSSVGIYTSYKNNLTDKLTLNTGLRFSYSTLDARFDTSFIKFPYREVKLREGLPTGSLGLVYRPAPTWQVNTNISSGFRMPNIDDIGKFFESVPGNITVPNPDLGAEYAWNFEAGVARRLFQKLNVEISAFYTILNNAIVRRPFQFNGQDSIDFDGVLSRVEALQNVARATVWGLQFTGELYLTPKLIWQLNANWINGRETDDVRDEEVPLRHAPPFYGNTNVRYNQKKFTIEFSAFYNGEVSFDELAPSERAKTDIYAIDAQGRPYSPSWYTLNIKGSYRLTDKISLNAGWENMTNQRYRTYSSGIVAPGSNLIFSVRATL
jgi:hemoglobin/transferrin/lactoferrin receptor protein